MSTPGSRGSYRKLPGSRARPLLGGPGCGIEARQTATAGLWLACAAALVIGLGQTGCVEKVSVNQGSNLECFYDGTRVYSGRMVLMGEGVEQFKEAVQGSYSLCGRDEPLICRVSTSSLAR